MTTSSPPQQRWADRLEAHLRGLKANKAALADLRTGLRRPPDECPRMHRYLASFTPDTDAITARERAVYMVAALYATYPDLPSTTRSLGTSLQQLQRTGRFSAEGIDIRLVQLARSQDTAGLCRKLPSTISLLGTAGVAVSWARLADDIASWDWRSNKITRRWLHDFHRPAHDMTADPHETASTGAD